MPLYQLYAHVALNRYDDTGEPSFAEAALRALDAAPASAGDPMPLHRARLDIALELGDYAAADRELEALRARGAPDLLLQRLSGKRHSYAGDFAEAEAHFQRALDIRPTRALLYQAAVNYYHWQHFAEAEALLDRSLALYPDDHDALNVRGLIHLQAGEMARAIADFEASLALHVDPTPLSNLGLAYLLQRDYPRSREFFQQVYRQDAGSPIFLINLADAESLLGNRETADALYREVIDSQERELAFVDLRALSQAYAQLGQYERAIATLKRIGENRRGGAETHFTAALVYALAQQDIAAVVEVEQALNAGYGAIWFTLPWFDGLCASGAFALALARHGFEGHCEGRVGNIAIN